jgi:hypothetical protein
MTVLPNHLNAQIEQTKLVDYCLSPSHPRGRLKARVFAETLGIHQNDAAWLKQAIFAGLAKNDATPQESDEFGQRWRVDMMLTRQNRRAVIRTVWIVLKGNPAPRFVTCWVL